MSKLIIAAIACASLAACKKSDSTSSSKEPARTAETQAAKPTEPTAPATPPTASANDIDLAAGGAAWKGWSAKGPDGAQVADDGAGGISVATRSFQLTITQGDLHLADMKAGARSGAEMSKGKVTFTTDKRDELAYVTETPNADGAAIKGYGFGIYVTVAGKKIGCSAVLDDEAQVAAAKALCTSLQKK